MKEKIINYFFDEDEKELVPMYEFLVKLAMVSFIATMIIKLI